MIETSWITYKIQQGKDVYFQGLRLIMQDCYAILLFVEEKLK